MKRRPHEAKEEGSQDREKPRESEVAETKGTKV